MHSKRAVAVLVATLSVASLLASPASARSAAPVSAWPPRSSPLPPDNASFGDLTPISTSASISASTTLMTPDGRYVTFFSNATDLPGATVDPDGDQPSEVYQWDRVTGSTVAITSGAGSYPPFDMSDDGRYVLLRREGWRTDGPTTVPDIQMWDRVTGATTTIASSAAASSPLNEIGDMTPDGRFVVFESKLPRIATDPGAPETPAGEVRSYQWDRTDDSIRLVGDRGVVDRLDQAPRMTSDGGHVLLFSSFTNLRDWDRATGTETTITGGVVAARISDDGSLITYKGRGPGAEIRQWNRATGTTTTISGTAELPPYDAAMRVSRDGRSVVFRTNPPDPLEELPDDAPWFHWDRTTGATTRLKAPSGADLVFRDMTADGRFVIGAAFEPSAVGPSSWDVSLYEWDRTTGQATQIIRGAADLVFANASEDGR